MGSLCNRQSVVGTKHNTDIEEVPLKCEEMTIKPPSQKVSRNKAPLLLAGYIHYIANEHERLSISVQQIILNYYYIEAKENIATDLDCLEEDQLIDVKDVWGTYLPAEITNIYIVPEYDNTFFLSVHFKGYSYAYDEWIWYDDYRICDCDGKCTVKHHRIAKYQTQQTVKQYTIYGMPKYKNIVGLCVNHHQWINPIMHILYHTPEFKTLVVDSNAHINHTNNLTLQQQNEQAEASNECYLVDELLYLFESMSSGEFQCFAVNKILLDVCGDCIRYDWEICDFLKWIINRLCMELEENKIRHLFQTQFGNKNLLYLSIIKNKINNMIIFVNIFNDNTMESKFDLFYVKCYETIKDLKNNIRNMHESNKCNIELFVANNIKNKRKSKRKKKRQRQRVDKYKMQLLDDDMKLKDVLNYLINDNRLDEHVLHLLCVIYNDLECDLLEEYNEILNEMNNDFYSDMELNKQIIDTALTHHDMHTVKLKDCIYNKMNGYKSMNIEIMTFPDILVIFCDQDRNKKHLEQKQIEEKNNATEEYVVTIFDCPLELNFKAANKNIKYSLYGVITCEQKCCSCIVKESIGNNQWYQIRNTDIVKLKKEQVTQNQNVCLLFYRQQS